MNETAKTMEKIFLIDIVFVSFQMRPQGEYVNQYPQGSMHGMGGPMGGNMGGNMGGGGPPKGHPMYNQQVPTRSMAGPQPHPGSFNNKRPYPGPQGPYNPVRPIPNSHWTK